MGRSIALMHISVASQTVSISRPHTYRIIYRSIIQQERAVRIIHPRWGHFICDNSLPSPILTNDGTQSGHCLCNSKFDEWFTRMRALSSILMLLIARAVRDVLLPTLHWVGEGWRRGVPSKWYNDRFVTFIDLEFRPRSGK